MSGEIIIRVVLAHGEASALAQMCKRFTFNRSRNCKTIVGWQRA